MDNFKATSVFKHFIILENFFCINRSYMINSKLRMLCNFIFITVAGICWSVIVYDLIFYDVSIGFRFLQAVCVVETYYLAKSAHSAKFLPMIIKLDEIFGDDENCKLKLSRKITKATLFLIVSTLVDAIGFAISDFTPGVLVSFFIASGAHDAEMSLYALLINGINLKLSKLQAFSGNIGAKIYGYILITSADISEKFSLRIIMMLALTFFKTVYYLVFFVLHDCSITILSIHMGCQLLKEAYYVWMLCTAVAESEKECKNLAFHLASTLTLDPKIYNYPKTIYHNSVKRWLNMVTFRRPVYLSWAILSINMSIMLNIIDLGITYMLIIVQIYIAFILEE